MERNGKEWNGMTWKGREWNGKEFDGEVKSKLTFWNCNIIIVTV